MSSTSAPPRSPQLAGLMGCQWTGSQAQVGSNSVGVWRDRNCLTRSRQGTPIDSARSIIMLRARPLARLKRGLMARILLIRLESRLGAAIAFIAGKLKRFVMDTGIISKTRSPISPKTLT